MNNQDRSARIAQRIQEAQASWNSLTGQIEALRTDLDRELDGQRRVVLRARLADLETERERVTAGLDRLEHERSLLLAAAALPSATSPPAPITPAPTAENGLELPVPKGAVPLGSPFYVAREADTLLANQLASAGSVTVVRGARQMGKTSLLIRGVDQARRQGLPVCFIDCQGTFDGSQLTSLDALLKSLAYEIADQAQVGYPAVDAVWNSPASPKNKATHFIEDLILRDVPTCFLLVLDEADMLLCTPFYNEFFGLLRAWYNRRTIHELWRKWKMVISISTHPSLIIDDLKQSPFNVGLTIALQDFGEAQVRQLNELHSTPLPAGEIPALIDLVGGHPYLVRQAFYTLKEQAMPWPELLAIAADRSGPFAEHLLSYLDLVLDDPGLTQAMRQVVFGGAAPPQRDKLRLTSAGLIRDRGRRSVCRFRLYEDFFREALR
ncbi:MAG: AAA-like domain-containing protein [Anaerolineae bacterium]|nr:AAA-like domain-containing protein [Anaerolineae bacterium]